VSHDLTEIMARSFVMRRHKILTTWLFGIGVFAASAGAGMFSAHAQSAAPADSTTSATAPATAPAAAAKPAKKQASISSAATTSDTAAGEKKLPTTRVTASGGRMVNPYSEQPETKYIKIPVNSKACPHVAGKPYFVEFRARNAASWGHTFVLYGKLGGGTSYASYKVAGLHPAGDSTQYTIGIWMPVKAEVGASDGDIDEQFLAAKYCVPLSEAEYNKVVPYIRKLQGEHKTWHGAGYNCNSFGMDVAKYVGLDAPNPNMHVPQELIKMLAESNKNRNRDPVGRENSLF
jgi:hypothetical protein